MTSKYLLFKNLLAFNYIQMHGYAHEAPLKRLFDTTELFYKLNCFQREQPQEKELQKPN